MGLKRAIGNPTQNSTAACHADEEHIKSGDRLQRFEVND
jgi:hypothetical protein